MNINLMYYTLMFTLPKPDTDVLEKWQGIILTQDPFRGFAVVWPGKAVDTKLSKSTLHSGHTFILRNGDLFKYAYCDQNGFNEMPEKWYSKSFQNFTDVPQENMVTVNLNGVFTEVPFLPQVLFDRKKSTKRRKKTHKIVHNIVYPMWKHQEGKTIQFQVAKQFKDLFDRADNGEVELMDPFAGYSTMEELNNSKTGRQAFRTVAGFVYHQCRDNLGYPLTL